MKTAATKSRVVLDASIALSWCFSDENSPLAEKVLDYLQTDACEAFVPSLWPYEIANILLAARRKKRISLADESLFLGQLRNLNIIVDATNHDRIFGSVLTFADEYHLSVYDASYLELSKRRDLPLATLDHKLLHSAATAKVKLFS